MFRTCTHKDVAASLDTIAAAFAILEAKKSQLPGAALLVSANEMFEQISARAVLDCVGRPLTEFLPRYVERQMRTCLTDCLAAQSPQEIELVIERDGTSRWWRFMVSPVVPDDRGNQRMIVTLIEITEKKLLEQQLELAHQRYAAVVDTAYDGVITIDQDQDIRMINNAARDIFGVGDAAVVGDHLSRFIPQRFRDNHGRFVNAFRHSPVKVRPMQSRSPIRGVRADGSEIDIEVTISKILVGNEPEMTAVVRDITERTKLIEQLQLAATHDALTGLYNRRHGATVLSNEVQRCRRFNHDLTVVMIDLDQFKEINDSYGHACGDSVLISTAATLAGVLRDADTICRWGGEEFLIVLPETVMRDALRWSERAREELALNEVTCAVDASVRITASFGIAALARSDSSADVLLKRADDALYAAKSKGRNRVVAAPDPE